MSGNMVGNLYVFFGWAGHTTVSEAMQRNTAIISGTVSLFGSFIFLLLRPLPSDKEIQATYESPKDAVFYCQNLCRPMSFNWNFY